MEAYIAGTVPMSTVDWPGNISLVIFFAGCDFKCSYCYNSKLVEFKQEFKKPIKELKEEIKKSLGFIDAVLFSGGECCLQLQALKELAKFTKSMELKVGIETNGTRPGVVRHLINERLIDFIGLDLKAPFEPILFENVTKSKTFFKTTEEVIDNIKETVEILKKNTNKLEIEIRTTVVPTLVHTKEHLELIGKEIQGLICTWSLQQFRPEEGKMIDKSLEKVKPPKRSELEYYKEHLERKFPYLSIKVKAID
ncbi:anaerobic ribonucleoside-triphosphate reductase activating protein [Candidatus Woesearchaeota archaeon]|nr:anaerobic ribonucleoside-triphosphate reductase activating protein [Candidatus Woesearchaeota archaeon]